MRAVLHENDRLGQAIEKRLIRSGWQVERVAGGRSLPSSLEQGVFDDASVLVLTADDDLGNVDMALTVRGLAPSLPIVVRVFDDALADYLRRTLDRLTVLTMSAAAAGAFGDAVERAIGERRTRTAIPSFTQRTPKQTANRGWRDRTIVAVILGFLAILTAFTLFFAAALNLSYLDAAYYVLTTVTTVGYGDIALKDASAGAKLAGMALMLLGSASIALMFGLFTDWVVKRRLEILAGRVRARGSGHVLVVGCGNIGVRVAELLRSKGHRIVAVERDPANKNLARLRNEGDHVILADATRDDTLNLAQAANAAVVLCLTDSDAVNFQIALLVRGENPDVPIVLRVVSPELSAHVSEHGGAIAVSPVAIASEEFVAAAERLAREEPA